MKLAIATVAAATTFAIAAHHSAADQGPLHKDIQREIVKQHDRIQTECGCSISFSYDRGLDFTAANGRSLAYNVEVLVRDVGTRSVAWCKKGDDFRAKLCRMVKALEVTEDPTVRRPYTTAVARGVVRSYIGSKNPKQLSNHGGAWVEKFLQTGKMPERKAESE